MAFAQWRIRSRFLYRQYTYYDLYLILNTAYAGDMYLLHFLAIFLILMTARLKTCRQVEFSVFDQIKSFKKRVWKTRCQYIQKRCLSTPICKIVISWSLFLFHQMYFFFMLSVQTPAHKMTFFPKSRKLTFMEIFLKECTKKCYKKWFHTSPA